ncbi:MAG TPA: UDP-glucose 4-epimerase GalE [Flavisolibacter sp.]|nr:UDP-glucose 4-epimerase GalE [Flavisolibacter sp.]
MAKILVTGGCGYIGSHTIIDLIDNGYDVICVDNNSRSSEFILKGVETITGRSVKNYKVDLCNFDETFAIFQENKDIQGIIHFAAYKAVGESVEKPLMYYQNNLSSLTNLLKCVQEFDTPWFVFSSSCTVYGNPDEAIVTEETPQKPAESPYGATKQMGERILVDFQKGSDTQCILLRYFNPVGAHHSILIGEMPIGKPQNLVPAITQTAIGKLPKMKVFGADYPTRDGSCVRDYIHVSDIAHAHTLAIKFLEDKKGGQGCEVFNLGTGNGVTVLEAINAFEKVSGKKLNYEIGPRRAGDVVAIYANNDKAKNSLGWSPKLSLDEMMDSAWKWEVKLKEDERLFTSVPSGLN